MPRKSCESTGVWARASDAVAASAGRMPERDSRMTGGCVGGDCMPRAAALQIRANRCGERGVQRPARDVTSGAIGLITARPDYGAPDRLHRNGEIRDFHLRGQGRTRRGHCRTTASGWPQRRRGYGFNGFQRMLLMAPQQHRPPRTTGPDEFLKNGTRREHRRGKLTEAVPNIQFVARGGIAAEERSV